MGYMGLFNSSMCPCLVKNYQIPIYQGLSTNFSACSPSFRHNYDHYFFITPESHQDYVGTITKRALLK